MHQMRCLQVCLSVGPETPQNVLRSQRPDTSPRENMDSCSQDVIRNRTSLTGTPSAAVERQQTRVRLYLFSGTANWISVDHDLS